MVSTMCMFQLMSNGSATCKVSLLLNGVPTMDTDGNEYWSQLPLPKSRGKLLRLKTNDELRVSVTAGTCFSSGNRHMQFCGFLLHP
jgi:hypothetical protein